METILELFKRRVNQLGPRPALWYKQEGSWEHQSWKEWWEQAERVAAGLIERGLEPHEPVCILAQTRIEWAWIDLGIWMAGGFVVPIYPTSRPEECRHILDEVGARFAFVENPSQLDKIADAASMEHMVYLERAAALPGGDWKGRHQVRLEDLEEGDAERAVSFDELSYEGRRRIADDHRFVATRRNAVSYDDLATVVYTSGTSGVPKGVEHTQGGLRAELAAIAELDLIGPDDRQLLFLPLAHIFARILFLSSLATASQVAFAESLSKTVANIAEVRPEFVAGVPRVFEKIREELIAESERLFGPNTTVWERAFRRGRLFSQKQRKGQDLGPLERLELKLYERLVFERVKRVFGGNIQYLFCGGAPLRAELAEFYHAMGLLVLEGYGLTETAAVSTLNLPDDFRFGSVGKPLPNVEVTIDEDGEILVRGPMVMRGYYDRPELTRETVESDESWFHTGDLGRFDRDGFLHVIGRKKELIVTSGGKNVAPEPIETALAERPLIDQAVVSGDDRPFLGALITLAEEAETWAIQQGIVFDRRADLAHESAVLEHVSRQVDAVNEKLPTHQQIRRFAVLDEPFSAADGELTPTGKLRRSAILENHRSAVDELYNPN